jgi:hypothetical protein
MNSTGEGKSKEELHPLHPLHQEGGLFVLDLHRLHRDFAEDREEHPVDTRQGKPPDEEGEA